MEIKFKKLVPFAQVPTKKYEKDAGFDLYCTSIVKTPKYIKYHTGIAIEIPDGMVGLLIPRSSIIDKDLIIKNSIGVIDSTYRGEIIFVFYDTKQFTAIQKKEIYEVGERIGQIVFFEIPNIKMVEVDELSETERGDGGFGSTGNN